MKLEHNRFYLTRDGKRVYEFPNVTIVKINNRFIESPKWSPFLKIERDRAYMLEALKMLREYKRI